MKNNKGFTLVEIIVTIVILSVLMAVVVPVSLSYLDDINEKKVLNEAQTVMDQLEASRNQLSLAGYAVNQNPNLSEGERADIVAKANGKGKISKVTFQNGEIDYMEYKVDDLLAVYEKSVGHFVIKDSISYSNIADAIMLNENTKSTMVGYFSKQNYSVGKKIDSEAGAANQNILGAGYSITQALKDLGYDMSNVSWQIEVLNSKNGIKRYQFLITDFKITEKMVNTEVNAMKYIYYENNEKDEGEYNSEKNYGV